MAFKIHKIESLDLPELAWYRTLKRPEEHERAGLVVASNVKVVERLLVSRFRVVSALLTPDWFARLEEKLRVRAEDIDVYIGEKPLLETIAGYKLHHGVLAAAQIPSQPSFESLLQMAPPPLLLAAVEGLASAENLGAVIRSAAAFGVHFLIVGETCISPFQRRAVSGSMGAIFEQPVFVSFNLRDTLLALQARGIQCVAAHPQPGAIELPKVNLRSDCCLVFGAEGPGLTAPVLAACNVTAKIPMPAFMNSLNVASAATVFLYEAYRQRTS